PRGIAAEARSGREGLRHTAARARRRAGPLRCTVLLDPRHVLAADAGAVMRGVALLGSTGSIGRSALSVLERHADEFRIVALAANRNAAELSRQIERYSPEFAVLVDDEAARANGPLHPCVRTSRAALIDAAVHPDADIVI